LPHSTRPEALPDARTLLSRTLPNCSPRRFAGDAAHRPAFRRRRGLRRPAALQPARAQQRLRQTSPALASAIGEAHAAGKKALRGQQRPAAQPQGPQLPGRHGAGRRPQARRADHGRPRADRPGARDLAGDAGPSLGAGQYRQLCGGAFLAKLGIGASSCRASCRSTKSPRFASNVPTSNSKSSSTARSVSPIRALPAFRILQPS
jgi:hypothetical protein